MMYKFIYLGLMVFGLGLAAATHGKERGKQNFWVSLIGTAVTIYLLNGAGFFDSF